MKRNKKLLGRGEFGYLAQYKKLRIIITAGMFFAAAAIFVAGLLLNDFNKGNIFTIIAALLIIPFARSLATLILVLPIRPVSKEKYDEISSLTKQGNLIYSDVIVTSTEKAMNLTMMVITASKVLIYAGHKKDDPFKVQEYIGGLVKRRGFGYSVAVTNEYEKFVSFVRSADGIDEYTFPSEEAKEKYEKNRDEMCAALESIMI